jgi:hypothetical protein
MWGPPTRPPHASCSLYLLLPRELFAADERIDAPWMTCAVVYDQSFSFQLLVPPDTCPHMPTV